MKRRALAVVPLVVLVSCDQDDIDKAISKWIANAILWIFKIMFYSLLVMVAWAALVLGGLALVVAGGSRKKFDTLSVLGVVAGGGIVVAAWPLIWTESGLLGALLPGSAPKSSAEPMVWHAVLVGIAATGALLFRRHRARKAAMTPMPVQSPALPPLIPPPASPLIPPPPPASPLVHAAQQAPVPNSAQVEKPAPIEVHAGRAKRAPRPAMAARPKPARKPAPRKAPAAVGRKTSSAKTRRPKA